MLSLLIVIVVFVEVVDFFLLSELKHIESGRSIYLDSKINGFLRFLTLNMIFFLFERLKFINGKISIYLICCKHLNLLV